ncbi:MAG: cob(I)yrinic acid a,c-diamide adenosyltransferase [Candidatus Lambdaproteobacteria bacterium]|nr:cob(I)yrinic acid a,c-diamide adenosyltransferase [Candidatus Lambdaproteobacteria bacterium]
MVKINKVYTRSGDRGNTALVGGRKVPKDHLRVEAYGTLDELNAQLGLVRWANALKARDGRRDAFDRILGMIQQRLFDLGAELATHPDDSYAGQIKVQAADVSWLETVIDRMNAELPALDSFILPGGGQVHAHLHVARTVCRRAERVIVALAREEAMGDQVLPYVNRLSDALFVFGRWVAATLGEEETLWQPGLAYDDSWQW